ncbi:hypothetical protein FRB95_005562 [Tulasnella sp. JGI-2019a]|nr:hypothetical protein FRB95_005562 [Tulasnella sp. JGI-2019a]
MPPARLKRQDYVLSRTRDPPRATPSGSLSEDEIASLLTSVPAIKNSNNEDALPPTKIPRTPSLHRSAPVTPTVSMQHLTLNSPQVHTSRRTNSNSTWGPRSVQKRRGVLMAHEPKSRETHSSLKRRKAQQDQSSDDDDDEDMAESPSKMARRRLKAKERAISEDSVVRLPRMRSLSTDSLSFTPQEIPSESDHETRLKSSIDDDEWSEDQEDKDRDEDEDDNNENVKVTEALTPKNWVTEGIYKLARSSFLDGLVTLGPQLEQQTFDATKSKDISRSLARAHKTAELKMKLGPNLADSYDYFKSVKIDQVVFRPGDTVFVELGMDDNTRRQTHSRGVKSANSLANDFWFAEIVSIYLTEDTPFFHVRWFEHASKTILGECSSPQELFLTDECDQIDARAVVAKANITFLPPGMDEPMDDLNPRDFFYRYFSLPHKATICDATRYIHTTVHLEIGSCVSCQRQEWEDSLEIPQIISGCSVIFRGETYHHGEFVFLDPETSSNAELYILAQIKGVLDPDPQDKDDKVSVSVQILNRQSPVEDKYQFHDDRLLSFSKNKEIWPADSLRSKFFVVNSADMDDNTLDAWVEEPYHFHIQGRFTACHDCHHAHQRLFKSLEVISKHQPLQALDLFAGSGGLALGLEQTGHVKTKWSVEKDESAVKTLESNRVKFFSKDHTCYNQDINTFTYAAYHNIPIITPSFPEGILPPDRNASGIDLIYGGPPCQSFSDANAFKKADDFRHGLSMVFLSNVDMFRPRYVLMENVRGMVTYGLHNSNNQSIKHGMLKIIFRCLTSMGYQLQFGLLNAGAYGTPQSRDRLIIMAARRDCPLPNLPIATHAFKCRPGCMNLTDGFSLPQMSNVSAGLPPTTVDMAISDLPAFDWKDPISDDQHANEEHHHAFTGMHSALQYHFKTPVNRYQMHVRKGSKHVHQHFTLRYSDITARRVVMVPTCDDANWEALPDFLKSDKWADGKKWRRYLFQRIRGDGFFSTSMTTVNPASRHGRVLHPSQKRVITFREYARSQGFPDAYDFQTVESTDHLFRQVGNAVPIPLGEALGRELGKAVAEGVGGL